MATKSPITNAEIKTRAYSAQGRENHERIFGKKKKSWNDFDEWAKNYMDSVEKAKIENGECPDCHGSGRIDMGGTFSSLDCGKCNKCDGKGYLK
jgi:excinuclease UvrABC ATPase subunit